MGKDKQLQIDNRSNFAAKLDRIAENKLSEAIMALKIIHDNELYIELGFESFKDYCEERFQIKKAAAYSYLKVADKFLPAHSNNLDLNESSALSTSEATLIPFRKLQVLSQLPTEQTQRLVTEGRMNIRGKEYTVAQINKMDRDQLRKTVRGESNRNIREEASTVPFGIVYKLVQQHLSRLLETTYKCEGLSKEQVDKIYEKAKELGELYDEIKKS